MGYVYKPIPAEILLAMPPDIRARACAQERAFLLRVQARQGGTADYGFLILALAASAIVIFFFLMVNP